MGCSCCQRPDWSLVLAAGPDSPTSPAKEPSTHTRALKLKHQSLEERLELCLLELRKLCIREAVRLRQMSALSVHMIPSTGLFASFEGFSFLFFFGRS